MNSQVEGRRVCVRVPLTTARLVLKPPHVLIHSSKTGSLQRRVFETHRGELQENISNGDSQGDSR